MNDERYNVWFFLKINCLVGLVLAALSGLLYPLLPAQQEMITIVIRCSLLAGLVPISFIIMIWLSVMALEFALNTIQELSLTPRVRSWGYVFEILGLIGFMLLMGVDGNDVMRSTTGSDLGSVMILLLISSGLIGLGWFVNHFQRPRRVVHTEFPGGWSERLEP